jgi:methylaspartate ammonia-lyase
VSTHPHSAIQNFGPTGQAQALYQSVRWVTPKEGVKKCKIRPTKYHIAVFGDQGKIFAMKVASLFSGIGGLDLGLHQARFEL